MKRLLCIWLCLSLLLCGCATLDAPTGQLKVVATIFPAYDFARQIGGERVQVQMLLPPGGEVHAFEPTLQDLAAIEGCDLFIYNGGESDGWVENLLKECDVSRKTVIRMMDYVELLLPGEQHHEQGHDHTHDGTDEHVWTTPQNGLLLTKAIADGLKRQDPSGSSVYEQEADGLQQQLTALQQKYDCLHQATDPLVVADRFPFLYLAHQYQLSYEAAFSGCTSNTEADLHTVHRLMTAAQHTRTSVVFYTEFSDGVLAETVARSVGGVTRMWHSCHNVTKAEWQAQVTYVDLMEQNLNVLKEALGL